MERHDVDVLVVGAGIAGLAVALSMKGRRTTLLCPRRPPAATASALAQGGIAAAMSADDSAHSHAMDTLRAGAGGCDPNAVQRLCNEAAVAIGWLERHGVRFDRRGEELALHREAGHSHARVLHVGGDRTGVGLIKVLGRAVRSRSDIEFLTGYMAIELTIQADRAIGVIAMDRTARPLWITARDTVLATGGAGQLFSRTSNPREACGDGVAMALAARVRCVGLPFMQFHPTALDVPADPLPLLTEALRGAGARLINDRGERFMPAVHPAAELAPRDVVAREVWKQTAAGGRVWLDATEVFRRDSAAFPAVRALCRAYRFNPVVEPLPVAPAAHYYMGGIAVDPDGRSSLDHLWACGEAACTGVHGANRLASNSLLEAVVFGRRLGRALTRAGGLSPQPKSASDWPDQRIHLDVDTRIWNELRDLMWAHLGIVREASGLQTGLDALGRLARQVADGDILLRNRMRLAEAMMSAALALKASRGVHFRSDFPAPVAGVE